jgi:hypothetical protein
VNPPPVVGSGTGLWGEYFNDPNNGTHFVARVLRRVDSAVNFDWAANAPGSGVTVDNFSVRWTGQVQAPQNGDYIFSTTADDGVRLWINGLLVIDNWVDQSSTTKNSAAITLVAGTRYDIRMEYYEHGGSAVAKLLWAYPGQSQTAIPTSQLYLPANSAPVVNAGVDQTITLPATAALSGTASDDGLPSPPGSLTYAWSKVSGAGTVTFSNGAALATTATFSATGTYVLRLSVSDGALTSTDDLTVIVNQALSPGLTGQYFNDPGDGTHFATLKLTRVDNSVNFNWSGSPGTGVNSNNFSVRWTGQVQAPVSGNFVFTTVSNDGIRVWVNGQQVINNWTAHSSNATNNSAAVALTAGVKYTITVEYYDRSGSAVAQLKWSYPGQATQVIPQSRLFH